MPIGPNGEKRPASPVANALRIMQVALGMKEEEYVEPPKMNGIGDGHALASVHPHEFGFDFCECGDNIEEDTARRFGGYVDRRAEIKRHVPFS